MIYACILAAVGLLLIVGVIDTSLWSIIIGYILYFIGLIAGIVIEDRLSKRIEQLEEKLRKENKRDETLG